MATLSDDEFAPKKIASAEFPTAFRGYDPDAVRSFLNRLASALEESGQDGLAILARTTTQDRIEELEEENEALRRDLRELELESVQRATPDEAPATEAFADGELDEHRAIELLGQETARVLESARSAAADIVKRSESDAAEKLEAADAELAAARKEARSYLTDKQAEVEELVAQVTSEAEESAQKVRDEADEHRQMVLDESNKILTQAEESADESERTAQARAEQIVADAEAIRQQILSELVVERTKSQTDMEEMVATRDRLAMALRVARSEIDEMSERLDTIAVRSESHKAANPDSADPAGLDASVDDEVAKLAAELDARLGLPPDDDSRDTDDAKADNGESDDAAAAADDPGSGSADSPAAEQTVIDLTDAASGDASDPDSGSAQKPSGRSGSPTSSAKGKNSSNGRRRSGKTKSNRSKAAKRATTGPADRGQSDGESRAATATAVAERVDEGSADDVLVEDLAVIATEEEPVADSAEVEVDETSQEAEQTESSTEVSADDIEADQAEPDETETETAETSDEEEPVSADSEAENQRIANGLIEGFTTIELTEADINLSDSGRDEPEQELSNIITTVESRSRTAGRGGDHDINRGDLRIEGGNFRGKLMAAFVARDKALKELDELQRAMRRVVNDDQSDVLDRIRAGKGRLKVDELAPFNSQLERYLVPVHRGLLPVGMAGARVGGRVPDAPGALERLEHAVARYIVDQLRIPVIQLLEEDETNNREAILDPIRSVYRDFRNGSLIDLVEDSTYEAFAIGVFAAINEGATVAWMLDPRYDPDPACEVNADRRGLAKGSAFPSGHARPLAVPGCRCLVVAD